MAELILVPVALGLSYIVNDMSKKTSYESSINIDKHFYDNSSNNSGGGGDDKKIELLDGTNKSVKNFKHNNMQPFFGSNLKLSSEQSHILDNKIGLGTNDISKKEQSPLFKPQKDAHYAHGSPNFNDKLQERQSKTMYKQNEKTWEEIQVAPGINEGYEKNSGSGYNSHLFNRDSYMAKNVDELRTKNNPKVSYCGRMNPKKAHNTQNNTLEMYPPVNKNRPETFQEQDSSRYIGANSDVKGSTLRPEHRNREEDKVAQSNYNGPGKGNYYPGHNKNTVFSKEKKNENLGSYPVLNTFRKQGYKSNDNDFAINGYNPHNNNRSVNNEGSFLGAAASVVGAFATPFREILRPTKKENLLENISDYGNATGRNPGMYSYNRENVPKTTRKETLVDKNMYLNVNLNKNGGYLSEKTQKYSTNRSETTSGRTGAAGGYNAMVSDHQNVEINRHREGTLTGRDPNGNGSLFNNNINIISNKKESVNKQDYAPLHNKNTPNRAFYGDVTNNKTEQSISHRIDSDNLTQLASNPYAKYLNT
jgi:hypothetical protein